MEAVLEPTVLDRLKTYRADQGRYVRLTTFWSMAALWFYGCYRLSDTLHGLRASWASFFRVNIVQELPLVEYPFSVASAIATVAFFAGLAGLQMFLNRPKIADTLIETEGELRKVTWPTVKDTINASLVVLVTVVILLMMIAGFDIVLSRVTDFLIFRS